MTVTWQFNRGFIEELEIDLSRFLLHAEALFQIFPLRDLRITGVRGRMRELLQCPGFSRIARLDLSGQALMDDDVRTFCLSPHAGNLTSLNLCGNQLTNAGVRLIAASPLLQQLEHIDVRWNLLTDPDVLISEIMAGNPACDILLEPVWQVPPAARNAREILAAMMRRPGGPPGDPPLIPLAGDDVVPGSWTDEDFDSAFPEPEEERLEHGIQGLQQAIGAVGEALLQAQRAAASLLGPERGRVPTPDRVRIRMMLGNLRQLLQEHRIRLHGLIEGRRPDAG